MADRVTYEHDIRPLFRDRDMEAMSRVLDLSSYDAVRGHAGAIYGKLAAGSCPPGSPSWDPLAPVQTLLPTLRDTGPAG
jgi:hypothetical protein